VPAPDTPFDPFGRRAEESSPTFPTRSAVARRRGPSTRPPVLRALGRLLAVALLLVAGGGAVAATLRHAVDVGADQSRAIAFALTRDPLGPRSLLRPAGMRRALQDAAPEIRAGERVESLTATPTRVLLTVVASTGSRRWIRVGVGGDRGTTSLAGGGAIATNGVRLRDLRPERALRVLVRRLARMGPPAPEPTVTASVVTSTSVAFGTGLVPRTTTRRQLRWTLSVEGEPGADRTLAVDEAGR
jgi:hypothetical protein